MSTMVEVIAAVIVVGDVIQYTGHRQRWQLASIDVDDAAAVSGHAFVAVGE